jgi:hypothetical protein
MAALDINNIVDMNTYHFLVANKLTFQPVATVGDQKVEGLGYWNITDPAASKSAGGSEATNLVIWCLTYAATFGTKWISDDESARAGGISQLQNVMGTAKSFVSDISAQLGKLFSFTSSAIPAMYATHFAQSVALSEGAKAGASVAKSASGSSAARGSKLR